MSQVVVLLAAAAESFNREVEQSRQGGQFSTHEVLLAISIGVGIGAVLFIATYLYFRKKHRDEERSLNRGSSTPKSSPRSESADDEEDSEPRRRRKRRRRRDHRERNPTLDKTGGLPPLRPEDEPPKF